MLNQHLNRKHTLSQMLGSCFKPSWHYHVIKPSSFQGCKDSYRHATIFLLYYKCAWRLHQDSAKHLFSDGVKKWRGSCSAETKSRNSISQPHFGPRGLMTTHRNPEGSKTFQMKDLHQHQPRVCSPNNGFAKVHGGFSPHVNITVRFKTITGSKNSR